jgi:hypothetical protein
VPTRFISWHGLCANRAAHEFVSAAPRFSQAPPFYHLAAQIAPLRQLKRYLINTFRPYLGILDGRRLSRRSYQQTPSSPNDDLQQLPNYPEELQRCFRGRDRERPFVYLWLAFTSICEAAETLGVGLLEQMDLDVLTD